MGQNYKTGQVGYNPVVKIQNSNGRRLPDFSRSSSLDRLNTPPAEVLQDNPPEFPISFEPGHVIDFQGMAQEIFNDPNKQECGLVGWFTEERIRDELEKVIVPMQTPQGNVGSWYSLKLQKGQYGQERFGVDIVGCPFSYGDLYELANKHTVSEENLSGREVQNSQSDFVYFIKQKFPTEICLGSTGLLLIATAYALWVRNNKKISKREAEKLQRKIEAVLEADKKRVEELYLAQLDENTPLWELNMAVQNGYLESIEKHKSFWATHNSSDVYIELLRIYGDKDVAKAVLKILSTPPIRPEHISEL